MLKLLGRRCAPWLAALGVESANEKQRSEKRINHTSPAGKLPRPALPCKRTPRKWRPFHRPPSSGAPPPPKKNSGKNQCFVRSIRNRPATLTCQSGSQKWFFFTLSGARRWDFRNVAVRAGLCGHGPLTQPNRMNRAKQIRGRGQVGMPFLCARRTSAATFILAAAAAACAFGVPNAGRAVNIESAIPTIAYGGTIPSNTPSPSASENKNTNVVPGPFDNFSVDDGDHNFKPGDLRPTVAICCRSSTSPTSTGWVSASAAPPGTRSGLQPEQRQPFADDQQQSRRPATNHSPLEPR